VKGHALLPGAIETPGPKGYLIAVIYAPRGGGNIIPTISFKEFWPFHHMMASHHVHDDASRLDDGSPVRREFAQMKDTVNADP
jgi:hypothetical protein